MFKKNLNATICRKLFSAQNNFVIEYGMTEKFVVKASKQTIVMCDNRFLYKCVYFPRAF